MATRWDIEDEEYFGGDTGFDVVDEDGDIFLDCNDTEQMYHIIRALKTADQFTLDAVELLLLKATETEKELILFVLKHRYNEENVGDCRPKR
jgi:hypothetical protein